MALSQSARLVSAGAATVAVSFGLARYGYGLLLPDLRAALELDSATLGLIGSGSFAAYLAATVAAGLLAARLGARRLVVLGGALAVAGMAIVAAAQGALALAAGIVVAGASSGLIFPPFGDAVQQRLPEGARGRALALISSGTGWGVLVSVPIALAVGASWRLAWIAFAAVAVVATLWAAVALGGAAIGVQATDRLRPSWFVCPRSGPLLAGALLIGLGSSVYWTFAVDLVAGEGGAAPSAARLVLALVGAASLARRTQRRPRRAARRARHHRRGVARAVVVAGAAGGGARLVDRRRAVGAPVRGRLQRAARGRRDLEHARVRRTARHRARGGDVRARCRAAAGPGARGCDGDVARTAGGVRRRRGGDRCRHAPHPGRGAGGQPSPNQ